ncbi:MAG: histone deacetylase [Theionarchaea archaeon]|nr:histone deacetylase [Theionarchaea archaeon]
MNVVFSPRCLEFRSPGHPESPDRVRKTYEFLVQKAYTFVEPTPCTEQELLLVHTPELVTSVKNNDFYNWDCPNLPHIYEYATLSAGGAITAMELSLSEGRSFSLMRPPGHHVTRENLGGFCYFNNIAIAVAKALSTLERVAILDFDCHHGNGTEAIFLGNPAVLYISWHQIHIYPGTGHQSQLNCINYPLNAGADHTDFMAVFEKGLEKTRDFNPDLIAVSAGFDGYIGDPLSMLRFQQKTYQEIGEKIKSFGLPSFAVLEGGYGGELPLCIHKFLEGYF